MMRSFISFTLLVYALIIGQPLYSQQAKDDHVHQVFQHFKAFRYQQVIQTVDSLLSEKIAFSKRDRLALLRMKAIAQYNRNQDTESAETFKAMLAIDASYQLDSLRTSPKIIGFFNDLKSEISVGDTTVSVQPPQQKSPPDIRSEKQMLTKEKPASELQKVLPSALWRSLLWPGWGHYYLNQNKKGYWISGFSLITIPAAVYYMYDTARKERDYLNAVDDDAIRSRYNDYNRSYQLRNMFGAAAAALWLYCQYDLIQDWQQSRQYRIGISYRPALQSSETTRVFIHLHF